MLRSEWQPREIASLPGRGPAAPAQCIIRLSSVRDLRRDPVNLGVLYGRLVRAPADGAEWLSSILAGLRQQGIEVLRIADASPADPDLAVEAEMLTAWVTHVSIAKSANVVVRILYMRGSTLVRKGTYRG